MVPTSLPHCCCERHQVIITQLPHVCAIASPRNNPTNLRHCEPQEIILVPTNICSPHHGIKLVEPQATLLPTTMQGEPQLGPSATNCTQFTINGLTGMP